MNKGCPVPRIARLSAHQYFVGHLAVSLRIPGATAERDEAGSATLRSKLGLVEDGVAAICTKRRCVKPCRTIARSHD